MEAGEEDDVPFIIRVSLGNTGKDAKNYESGDVNIMIITTTIFLVLIFVSFLVYRQLQSDLIMKIDEGMVSPADFTVMVSNIPNHKTKDEIKSWL